MSESGLRSGWTKEDFFKIWQEWILGKVYSKPGANEMSLRSKMVSPSNLPAQTQYITRFIIWNSLFTIEAFAEEHKVAAVFADFVILRNLVEF